MGARGGIGDGSSLQYRGDVFFARDGNVSHETTATCVGIHTFLLVGDGSIYIIPTAASWQYEGRGVLFLLVSMAPHLTKFELDFIFEEEAKGASMKEIHRMVQRRRTKQGHDAPCLRGFSEAFRGRTYMCLAGLGCAALAWAGPGIAGLCCARCGWAGMGWAALVRAGAGLARGLIGWITGWMTGWMTGWLAAWLAGRLYEWLIACAGNQRGLAPRACRLSFPKWKL